MCSSTITVCNFLLMTVLNLSALCVVIFIYLCIALQVQVLKVCRTPGLTACSMTKMYVYLLNLCVQFKCTGYTFIQNSQLRIAITVHMSAPLKIFSDSISYLSNFHSHLTNVIKWALW